MRNIMKLRMVSTALLLLLMPALSGCVWDFFFEDVEDCAKTDDLCLK